MLSLSMIVAVFAILLTFAYADFWIANTTACMGASPVRHCFPGAHILMASNDNKTDFRCGNLINAHDHYYLNSSITQTKSQFAHSDGGVCGEKGLKFENTYEMQDDGFIYNVTTRDGDYKGKCVKDMDYGGNGTTAKCDMWIGGYFFRTVLRCESDICT